MIPTCEDDTDNSAMLNIIWAVSPIQGSNHVDAHNVSVDSEMDILSVIEDSHYDHNNHHWRMGSFEVNINSHTEYAVRENYISFEMLIVDMFVFMIVKYGSRLSVVLMIMKHLFTKYYAIVGVTMIIWP